MEKESCANSFTVSQLLLHPSFPWSRSSVSPFKRESLSRKVMLWSTDSVASSGSCMKEAKPSNPWLCWQTVGVCQTDPGMSMTHNLNFASAAANVTRLLHFCQNFTMPLCYVPHSPRPRPPPHSFLRLGNAECEGVVQDGLGDVAQPGNQILWDGLLHCRPTLPSFLISPRLRSLSLRRVWVKEMPTSCLPHYHSQEPTKHRLKWLSFLFTDFWSHVFLVLSEFVSQLSGSLHLVS